MPPNVLYSWDSNAAKRHYHDDDDDHAEFDAELFLSKNLLKQPTTIDDNGRSLWKKILRKDMDLIEDQEEVFQSDLLASLSSIIILDDEIEREDWLNRFGGCLSKVSSELLQELRKHAPDVDKMSTVADFNDNLFYHMQRERGLEHFTGLRTSQVRELENTLQASEYLGSFLTTKSSLPQPPHVDYPWEVLEQHAEDESLKIAFFPLTEEGMFLQIWPTSSPSQDRSIEIEGQIIFVPYGKILIVPASTIHGGGFRTTVLEEKGGYSKSTSSSGGGNLRFHLYIATNQTSLPAHQTNKYTEPCDKTKELSRRYVDSEHMQVLLENLFV